MGITDLGDKISEFRGIKHMFKSSSNNGGVGVIDPSIEDGEERGIAGGPQRFKGRSSKGGRSWMKLDDDSEGNHKMLYIVRGAQLFFLIVAIFINAALAAFQKKWKVGTSGLVAFTFFAAILMFLQSAICLVVPLLHERSGRFNSLARSLKRPRPAFIINSVGTALCLILSFVLTISSNTKGCKDPKNDAHAELEGYTDALPTFCRNKRALTAFLWFGFITWLVSLVLTIVAWKRTRSAPSIPAFTAPEEDFKAEGSIDGDEGSYKYEHVSGGDVPYAGPSPVYSGGGFAPPAASRQSTTFYEGGRPFDDPTPAGYGSSPYTNPYETAPSYDDPYERIRRERGLA